ncbi:MAG: MFS transporter [Candidatus Saccharimonadales bacterium]
MTPPKRISHIKTKHLFILQSFVSNALVIYPLYAIMFTERGGLSVGDVSVLFAIWTAAALVFELPTGLIADRYPRKHVLIIGELVNAGAFLVWLFLPTFFGYAIGFVLWGAAYALKSGAYQALVYDELASGGRSNEYTKTMSRIKAAEFSGMLLAFVSASLLSINGVNYGLLLIVSVVTGVISAGLLLLLPDVRNRQTDAIIESQPKLLKRALKTVVRNPRIRIITAWLAVVAGFIGWYEEYTPLFDSTAGIATKYIPLVISVVLVLNILASLIAPRFEKGGMRSKAALILGAGLIVVFSTLGWWLPVIITLAHGGLILLRVLRILLDAELQHAADGSVRATLGSIAGLLSYPLTIGVALGFALLSKHMQGFLPFRWVGIAILIGGMLLLLTQNRATKTR